MSSKMRSRLFWNPCGACLRKSGKKLKSVAQTLETVGVPHHGESQSGLGVPWGEAGHITQRQKQAQTSAINRAESSEGAAPSEGAGPSDASEPAPPVPVSVVPGLQTIVDDSGEQD